MISHPHIHLLRSLTHHIQGWRCPQQRPLWAPTLPHSPDMTTSPFSTFRCETLAGRNGHSKLNQVLNSGDDKEITQTGVVGARLELGLGLGLGTGELGQLAPPAEVKRAAEWGFGSFDYFSTSLFLSAFGGVGDRPALAEVGWGVGVGIASCGISINLTRGIFLYSSHLSLSLWFACTTSHIVCCQLN